jgi:biopolymer transport protein ExbD
LLIFTMLSMQIGKFQLMELDFPQVEKQGSTAERDDAIKIYILSEGVVMIGNQKHSLDAWHAVIQKSWKDKNIILASEKKVPYEHFVQVLEKIQAIQPKSLELGLKEK